MPVQTPSGEYEKAALKWERCRDAYEGGDAIKAKTTRYLPALDSHQRAGTFLEGGLVKYQAYMERALWYNATARTVDGLAGGIFQKAPKITAPEAVVPHLSDVTLTSQSAEMFALQSAKDVLQVGRSGILVEWGKAPKEPRPYWACYKTEDIVSYRAIAIDGDEILTRVVLRETTCEDDPDDEFTQKRSTQYRVLELVPNGDGLIYIQTEWKKVSGKDEWAVPVDSEGERIAPMVIERRGKPLDFIPFVFLGPTSIAPAISKPPLLDLVDVNISHYRTMADLEHGRHRVAVPTPWVSGFDTKSGPILLGETLILAEGGSAGMLEFTGQGLGALERADQQKRHMMAVLGARLLEEQGQRSNVSETAAAVGMRHAGEQATLKTLAQALETGLTLALQWHAWWFGTEKKPSDTGAVFELNKDFSTLRMPPEELRALVEALQAKAISPETFYHNLEEGGLVRPGVTVEEELQDIEDSKPEPPPPPTFRPLPTFGDPPGER